MPTAPRKISLANLQASAVSWQADEAIALVVQVGERLRWRDAPPPPESIYVAEDGVVELFAPPGPPATAAPYAELLHRLLPEPEPGRASKVPGRVRIMVARALGQTALPPLVSAEEFGSRLKTVVSDQPSVVLAGVFARSLPAESRPHACSDDLLALAVPSRERRRVGTEIRATPGENRSPIPLSWDELTLEGRSVSPSESRTTHPEAPVARSPARRDGSRVIPALGHRADGGNKAQGVSLVGLGLLMLAVVGFGLGRMATSAVLDGDAAPSRTTHSAARHDPVAVVTTVSSVPKRTPMVDEPGDRTDVVGSVAPTLQGGLVPVAVRDGQTFSPSFGNAGDTLFFHTEYLRGTRLMEARTDTDGRPIAMAVLLTDDARNYHVRMSPDGRRLAYDSDRDGVRGIYVKPVNGDTSERVSGPRYAAVPVWSPDARHLAFVRGEADHPRVWNLWLADLSSGDQRRLTNHRVGQVWPGNWFRDGQRIVYTHETRLWVLDTASGTRRSYETPIAGRLLRTASVSSDGRRVAFQVYRDGLWVLDLSTGQMSRWLADPSAEEFAWSPDDSRLAFHSHRGGRWQVWTMAAH